jgi:hypothetical protein
MGAKEMSKTKLTATDYALKMVHFATIQGGQIGTERFNAYLSAIRTALIVRTIERHGTKLVAVDDDDGPLPAIDDDTGLSSTDDEHEGVSDERAHDAREDEEESQEDSDDE